MDGWMEWIELFYQFQFNNSLWFSNILLIVLHVVVFVWINEFSACEVSTWTPTSTTLRSTLAKKWWTSEWLVSKITMISRRYSIGRVKCWHRNSVSSSSPIWLPRRISRDESPRNSRTMAKPSSDKFAIKLLVSWVFQPISSKQWMTPTNSTLQSLC